VKYGFKMSLHSVFDIYLHYLFLSLSLFFFVIILMYFYIFNALKCFRLLFLVSSEFLVQFLCQ